MMDTMRPLSVWISVLVAVLSVACGGGGGPAGAGPGGPGGGMPPMPVEAVTLTDKPVERSSEFIASLKSRQSTTIQPQVEGLVTRIAVQSGQRVEAGAVLFEIDSARQQATVGQLQSMRSMRAADVEYARQQTDRSKTLFQAGAISQRELEQAETAVRTSQAQLDAVDQQIREQQVELGYYKVTSPNAGVVGDIPVRPGDRVTPSTVLTTVDVNAVLELHINVPVQQAPELKIGLPVRILDEKGQVIATNRVTFISPTVEDATQTVLAKVALNEGRGQFRADQFVRVRVVWRTNPGLTVPLTSVIRVNAQHFVYVVEKNGEQTVAKQRPVQLGDLIGNDYVVISGLKAGDQLIVGGIQKIGDGAPIKAGPPPAAPAPTPAAAPQKGA
jgi:RND family efflux transporter MFP subunit